MATLLRVLRLLPLLLLLVLSAWPTQTAAHASGPGSRPAPPAPLADLAPLPAALPPSEAPAAASPAPRQLRRLLKKEVRPGVAREARRIIDSSFREPFGTEIPFVVEGREYIARIEEHYHPPGGEARPWGKHAGVSVLVAWPADGH